jgi:hypothetical protein
MTISIPNARPNTAGVAIAANGNGNGHLLLTRTEVKRLSKSREFLGLLRARKFGVRRIKKALHYERELKLLQIELVKMQRWVQLENKRVAVIFEGRDAAGRAAPSAGSPSISIRARCGWWRCPSPPPRNPANGIFSAT